MFETFVFVWANTLTVWALLLAYAGYLSKNASLHHEKDEIRFHLSKKQATIELNFRKDDWRVFRYAVYALIAQCLTFYMLHMR